MRRPKTLRLKTKRDLILEARSRNSFTLVTGSKAAQQRAPCINQTARRRRDITMQDVTEMKHRGLV
jgi:hypothetical protein